MTAVAEFQEVLARYQEAKTELDGWMTQRGSEVFAEQFAKGRHPRIAGFSWTQYTPYFNDGDPCTFGVNEIDEGWEIWEAEADHLGQHHTTSDHYLWVDREGNLRAPDDLAALTGDPTFAESIKAINQVFVDLLQDVFEKTFGDHKRISVKYGASPGDNGPITLTVDDYEHD